MTSSLAASTLVFVDPTVSDYQSLISNLPLGVEAIVLDPTQDGILQITETLAAHQDIASVQILSHGSAGSLNLGTSQLSLETIASYTPQLEQWSRSLTPNADILLLGCAVGQGEAGEGLVDRLSQLTQADVAASNNLTGKGGDWELEVMRGAIEAPLTIQLSAQQNYAYSLATFVVSNANDSGTGSLRDAILQANVTAGADIIQFDPAFFATARSIQLSSELLISGDVTLQGTGANLITINGNNAVRVFNITSGAAAVTLNGLTINGGNAGGSSGGGILFNSLGTLTVNNSVFTNNQTTSNGGAIYSLGTLNLNNSTLSNNTAQTGGGVFIVSATNVTNSTFANNQASNAGGGIYSDGSVALTNSTLSLNRGTVLGGGLRLGSSGTANINNSILFGNTSATGADISGNVAANYSVIGSTSGAVTGGNNTNANPQLSALRDNGGTTPTFALLPGSSAIDTGNPSQSATPDQRGLTRNGAVDIGAYEVQPPPSVVSIVTANLNPTNSNTVDFTVTFNQAVTGVDITDFGLTVVGLGGTPNVSQVTGSGTTYTVRATTGSGSGTLRLNLVDDDTIVDISNTPIGGFGTGNGVFTTGQAYTIDRTAPTLTIPAITPSPRNSSLINMAIAFSEAVNNFDLADLTLTRDGVAIDLTGTTLTTSNGGQNWSLGNLTGLTSTSGTYLLTVLRSNITDLAGNALTAGGNTNWVIDLAPPTVTVQSVTPNPRNSPAGSMTIQFSEAVTNFDRADLTLTRDGVAVALGSATLNSGDNINWTLGNLSGINTTEGNYQLTVNVSNVTDQAGNALAANGSAAWAIDLTAPTADLTDVSPDPRNTAVNSIPITFSEAVQNVDLSDFALTRNGVAVSLTGATVTGSGTNWTISNLNGLTNTDGSYQLTLNVGDIRDLAGNALNGSAIDSWTIDLTPPTADVVDVAPDPRNTAVNAIALTFSESVNNFDLADLTLTRNGVAVSLTGAVLSTTNRTNWTLSNLSAITTGGGNYQLSINPGSGITDDVGNALTSGAIDSWTNDLTAPGVAIAPVTPSPRNTPVSSISINFLEAVNNFDLTDLTLFRNGAPVSLAGATLNSTNGVNWTLSGLLDATNVSGSYQLTLSPSDITDQAGNLLTTGASEVWAGDFAAPIADIVDISPDPRNSNLNTITIRFDEAVRGLSLSDLQLTRNGSPVSLTGATLSTDNNVVWTIGNLGTITNREGAYQLTLTAANSNIRDAAGNPLATDVSDSWIIDFDAETEGECPPGQLIIGTLRNDTLLGSGGSDRIRGRRGNDVMFGYGCDDIMRGNAGNDTMSGDAGEDFLFGGTGNDALVGGGGSDTLTGNRGADRFIYSGANRVGALFDSVLERRDRITDFKYSEGDRFQLDFDSNIRTANRPMGLFNAGRVQGSNLIVAARDAYADKNQAAGGAQRLRSNEALFFTWRGRTYLSVNDNARGFSAANDLIVDVTRMQFKTGDNRAGVLTVADYFV